MSSSSKTTTLGLNQWSGGDCPKRDDFNQDNQKIDNALKQHVDSNLHLTPDERACALESALETDTYLGDGQPTRVVEYDDPGKFRHGVYIFKVGAPLVELRDGKLYQNFVMSISNYSPLGVSLTPGILTVSAQQSGNTVINLNEAGVRYGYVLFRKNHVHHTVSIL